MQKKKLNVVRVGMIGMGYISHIHLAAYAQRKDVCIQAVSDNNQGLLLRKAAELGVRNTYPDYRFMLRDDSIDVVDVMTPHFLHKQIVCEALQAGKVVICEKPLATTLQDVDTIFHTSSSTGKRVYIKEYFRYSLANQKAITYIRDGDIGTPYYIQCIFTGDSRKEFLDPASWRGTKIQSGGGVFMDIGVHILDWLQLAFGKPISVYAQHRNVTAALPNKGEDFATLMMEYPNSVMANITTTQNDIGYRFRWEIRIYGTNGVITILDDGIQLKTAQVVKENKVRREFKEPDWWRQSNIRVLNDIIDNIKHNAPPTIPNTHTRSVMQTVFRSYDAARTGKRIEI